MQADCLGEPALQSSLILITVQQVFSSGLVVHQLIASVIPFLLRNLPRLEIPRASPLLGKSNALECWTKLSGSKFYDKN